MKGMFIELDFLSIKDNFCILEGKLYIDINGIEPIVSIFNGTCCFYGETKLIELKNKYFNEPYSPVYSFKIEFEIIKNITNRIIVKSGRDEYYPEKIIYNRFLSLSNYFKKMYFTYNGFLISQSNEGIVFKDNNLINHTIKELSFLGELISNRDINDRRMKKASKKAFFLRQLIVLLKLFKNKPLWLFSDRVNLADDNGIALFDYVYNTYPTINSIFAISNNHKELNTKYRGRVIKFFSLKYKICFLLSDYVLSSSGEEYATNPFGGHFEPYKDLINDVKIVFLQHGIAYNDLSLIYNRYNTNFYKILTSSARERQSFLLENYGYSEDNVCLTGLPRFDLLKNNPKKIITIMFTWRKELMDYDKEKQCFIVKKNFVISDYYKNIEKLVKDERLRAKLSEKKYNLNLMLHPLLENSRSLFLKLTDSFFSVNENKSFNQIFEESSLLITDYSSSVFDFAYLEKPILYFQPDKTQFYSKHTVKEGFFLTEDDGFGEVEKNLDDLIERIIEYIDHDCIMKDKYKKRSINFFAFHDKRNRERVCNMLIGDREKRN